VESSLCERPERRAARRLSDHLVPEGCKEKVHSLVDKVYARKNSSFRQLDGWIVRRLRSHRAKRWRNALWRDYPAKRLRDEFELVSLVSLIPSLQISKGLS